jgi:hypothetical protein
VDDFVGGSRLKFHTGTWRHAFGKAPAMDWSTEGLVAHNTARTKRFRTQFDAATGATHYDY